VSEIELNPIVRRFAERSPLPVMARAILERCLGAQQLDEWFERQAQEQYTRELLFSSVYELMTQVVLGQHPTVHAAVRDAGEAITVSVTSVYNKLKGLEVDTSAALVGWSASQAGELIQALQAAKPALLPGLTVKVLDGNVLDGREHRLKESRARTAAPLPGKVVAVFDPQCEVIEAIVPSEDAYTQERALLPEVLSRHVGAGQLWLADRNFCTTAFLEGLVQRQAHALIREHGLLRFTPLEPMREIGLSEGAQVGEQWVHLGAPDQGATALKVRRIRLKLAQPTRDGDDTLCLLTTLGSEHADALTLARLYRQRWTIERAFLHLTTQLRCEVRTLSYPGAALFALACAMTAFNVLAVLKAALRAAHGLEAEQSLSGYYMAIEMGNAAHGLDTIVDPEDWTAFRLASTAAMAAWLHMQAQRLNLARYRKSVRGPKKPAVKRVHDPHQPHFSVARVLKQRKTRSP
jgi:Transposase DDE domain